MSIFSRSSWTRANIAKKAVRAFAAVALFLSPAAALAQDAGGAPAVSAAPAAPEAPKANNVVIGGIVIDQNKAYDPAYREALSKGLEGLGYQRNMGPV